MAQKHHLKRYPNTLLGSDLLACFFDKSRQEYFFDRDPYLFRYILNYYNCGKLHASQEDCPIAFKDELDFFGIPLHEIEDCCWLIACDKRENNQVHYMLRKTSIKSVHTTPVTYVDSKLRGDHGANALNAKEMVFTKECFGHVGSVNEKDNIAQNKTACTSELRKIRKTDPVDHCQPNEEENYKKHPSSCASQPPYTRLKNAFNFLYGLFIISSVVVTSLETVDCSEGIKCEAKHRKTFFVADSIFVAVFTLEFVARLALSRDRCTFMKDLFNLIDLLAILPYYLTLLVSRFVETTDVTVLMTLRVFRVSRIMKLTRGSTRLQTFLYTLKNCYTDLLCLYFIFTLGILLFASALYYVEKEDNPDNFPSIPHSLWYTCVTMMTTG